MRYSEFLEFHKNHYAEATMAVRTHEWQNPFGVVTVQGLDVVGLEEKPIDKKSHKCGRLRISSRNFQISKAWKPCDILICLKILGSQNRTLVHPMHEPWLDTLAAQMILDFRKLCRRNK